MYRGPCPRELADNRSSTGSFEQDVRRHHGGGRIARLTERTLYTLNDASLMLSVQLVPIWVAGNGPRLLDLAARYARAGTEATPSLATAWVSIEFGCASRSERAVWPRP